MPSNSIDRTRLNPPEVIIRNYSHFRGESKAGSLTAREAFFGAEVMRACTVSGQRDQLAFPIAELNALKQQIFSLFPQYWANPAEFEGLWKTCARALNQACKAIRKSELTKFTHST